MLEKIKVLLGVEGTDIDSKLELIISTTTSRLKILLGGVDIPEELEYIIVEVAVARFNKIGSEGLTSHTVEGESLNYSNNDFAAYSDEIQAYLDTQKTSTRGKVRFL